MKTLKGAVSVSMVLGLIALGSLTTARGAERMALRYAMEPGKTNAYAVTITQQGESGRETVGGTLLVSVRKTGDFLAVNVKGQLRPKMTPGGAPPFMGYRPGGPVSLNSYLGFSYGPYPETRDIVVDANGSVLRLSGDSALPIPLGSLLTSFLTVLPSEPNGAMQKEERVFVLDEPLLAGPAPVYQPSSGPMTYYPGKAPQAAIAARQKTSVKITESTAETVTLQETKSVESVFCTGAEPRISGSSTTKRVLDRVEGWPRLVETEAQSAALTDDLSRRCRSTLKWQLLEGAERETALTPPPARPQEIPGAELAKLMADLESENTMAREAAARELTMSGRTVKPTLELVALAVKLTGDRNDTVRRAGQTLVAHYGTREHVPLLLRALNEAGDSTVRNAIATGLGRLQDPRAAEPLAQLIASGQSDQSGLFRHDTPLTEALVKIGPAAEPAVLALLKEKHTGTRITACFILKQIGSKKSLSALKELTSDSTKELSEAAAEAARSIQGREKGNL